MKLAHLADLHLAFRRYHRTTASGANQREVDLENAWRTAIDGVIASRADLAVVAGDMFHGPKPSNGAIVAAIRGFQRLRAAGIPAVCITGNHDTPRTAEGGSIFPAFAELGVHVAIDRPCRFQFPELDCSVLAVPHAALIAPDRPAFEPDPTARYNVLVIHGDTESPLLRTSDAQEYGGAMVLLAEVAPAWNYVAFGHYHVQHMVAPRVWYAGALDYCSSNTWGELLDEAKLGISGKAWLLANLATDEVTRMPVEGIRRHLQLTSLDADNMTGPELTAAIFARLDAVPGGIRDAVIRLRIHNVPRTLERLVDHVALRKPKAEALALLLEYERPVLIEVGPDGSEPPPRTTYPATLHTVLRRHPELTGEQVGQLRDRIEDNPEHFDLTVEEIEQELDGLLSDDELPVVAGDLTVVDDPLLLYLGRRDVPPGMTRSEYVHRAVNSLPPEYGA